MCKLDVNLGECVFVRGETAALASGRVHPGEIWQRSGCRHRRNLHKM